MQKILSSNSNWTYPLVKWGITTKLWLLYYYYGSNKLVIIPSLTTSKVWVIENLTKHSSNALLRLVRFFATQTLSSILVQKLRSLMADFIKTLIRITLFYPGCNSQIISGAWPQQRVIRREPKIECYVLAKVKSPPFFRTFYDDF